jgi:hypothetical protein
MKRLKKKEWEEALLLISIKMKTISQIFDNMNEKQIRVADRAFGALRAAYPIGLLVAVNSFGINDSFNQVMKGIIGGLGIPLFVDGLGDFITGEHHCIFADTANYFNERRNIRYLL